MLHYYEKLIISIVLFLGVTICTAFIVGNYVKVVKGNDNPPTKVEGGSIVLDNINIL